MALCLAGHGCTLSRDHSLTVSRERTEETCNVCSAESTLNVSAWPLPLHRARWGENRKSRTGKRPWPFALNGDAPA